MPLVLRPTHEAPTPDRVDGITLFEGGQGWQLSYRFRGDNGWSVHRIPGEQARDVLEALASCVVREMPELMTSATPSVPMPAVRPPGRRRAILDVDDEPTP